MKFLRKYRGYDLKGPNSPYRTERFLCWACWFLRHPVLTFRRSVAIRLADDSHASVLYVYGNLELPAYSGVQIDGAQIEGNADSLRRLAALLINRAERVEAVQHLLDAGTWPSYDDVTGFPDGFGDEVPFNGLRLGRAPLASREVDAP